MRVLKVDIRRVFIHRIIIALASLLLVFLNIPFYVYAEDTGPFRFAVMGCMHFGVSNPEDYELAVEKIKQYHPDFVLFLGGMVDAVGEKPVESLWREFDRITERLGVPVYNISSDSCLSSSSVHTERTALMEKCFLDRYKGRYYTFEYKNNLFICLDSSKSSSLLNQKKGELIDKAQLNFLKKVLSNSFGYDNVFMVINRSAWFPGESKWFETIHPLIKEKVKYVFGAHKHFFDLRKIDDVTYVTTGTAPELESQIKPSFFHFLIVDVDKNINKVDVKIVPVKPIAAEALGKTSIETEAIDFPRAIIEGKRYLLASYLLTSPERESIMKVPRVIKALDIKPGMDILDIGAGTGFFAFPFAEALKGKGRVFATEVNTRLIDYMEKEIKNFKYKNVVPVLVQDEGLDPFYKQHTFDIIFLCEVYGGIFHPQDFLKELRPSLKTTGRLYILHVKNSPDFSEIEFDDFKKVMKILISEGENFPVFKRLRKSTQHFVKNWRDNSEVPLAIRRKIVRDFNRMLSDRFLFNDVSDYYARKTDPGHMPLLEKFMYPEDFRLTKWLVANMDEEGGFNQKEPLSALNKKRLRRLNRMILTGIFQSDKFYGIQGLRTCAEANSIVSKMESAGYKFVREYDFLPYHHFLEFKRAF